MKKIMIVLLVTFLTFLFVFFMMKNKKDYKETISIDTLKIHERWRTNLDNYYYIEKKIPESFSELINLKKNGENGLSLNTQEQLLAKDTPNPVIKMQGENTNSLFLIFKDNSYCSIFLARDPKEIVSVIEKGDIQYLGDQKYYLFNYCKQYNKSEKKFYEPKIRKGMEIETGNKLLFDKRARLYEQSIINQ